MEVQWGQVESYSEVQSVNGLTGKVQLKIPTKTSDLTNDSGFITEVSGDFATKDDLTAVENKIPDVSGLATKTEVATQIKEVKSTIPDTTGLATKSEVETVKAAIPSEYLEKVSVADNTLTISDNSGNATVFSPTGGGEADLSNYATKAEVKEVENKIPDVRGFATKDEVTTVENKIPSEYLKSASVADNILAITDATGTTTEFQGGSEKFIVTIDETADKTYDEILAAYNSGKEIVANFQEMTMPLLGYLEEDAIYPAGFTFGMLLFGSWDGTDSEVVNQIQGVGITVKTDNTLFIFGINEDFSTFTTKTELNESVSNLATKTELTNVESKVPTKISELTNDSGYLTSHQDISNLATKAALDEAAAKIPIEYLKSAAVANNKLTITDSSGNATTFTGTVDSVNGQTGTVVIDIPTKVSELENDSGYLTTHQDISNLATKDEIPSEYIKSASISNNNLVLTDATGTEVIDKQAIYIDTQITEITQASSNYEYVRFDLSLPSLTCAEVNQLVQKGYNVYLRVTGEILQNLGCDVVIAPCTVASNTIMGFFAFALMDHIIYCWQDNDATSFGGIYAAVPFKTDLETIKNSIPTTYLKSASVSDNTLTLTDATGTNITFTGGSTTDLSSYSNTTEVQAMIDTAISNITNANEVSY